MERPGSSSADAPFLLERVLEQVLAGADPHTMLLPKGLLNELKTARLGCVLDAWIPPHLAGRGVSSFQPLGATAPPRR